ncbi:hypothetical protein SPD48_00765 [Pseudogracilibacillus sp. SE30717A]|uniref:hypothetical protein n=1 Tax=Pseudogracilibacillus sp. SE30717A TaxID=3098293 RepID=UPI00300E66D1
MRKYWKTIALSVFIVIGISMFYINVNTVTKEFPRFNFKIIEGNEEAVDKLVINGDLYNGMTNFEQFRVNSTGTTYLRDEPFSKRIIGYYQDIYGEDLQKEYRTFMRGKSTDPAKFYETDEILAYAETPYSFWSYDTYEFEIDILNKKTKKTVSFSTPIPDRANYWYVAPYGVYVDENEISIITLNEQVNEDVIENTSVHVYTYNIDTEQLVGEEVIDSLNYSSSEDGYNDIQVMAIDENIFISQQKVNYIETEDDFAYEKVNTEKIIHYNVNTHTKEEFTLPEKQEIGMPITIIGDELFLASINDNKLEIISLNLIEGEINSQKEIEVSNSFLSLYDLYQAKVKDGKYYFIPSSEDFNETTMITVVDLESLTVDYLGEIEPVGSSAIDEEVEMYFSYPELRK